MVLILTTQLTVPWSRPSCRCLDPTPWSPALLRSPHTGEGQTAPSTVDSRSSALSVWTLQTQSNTHFLRGSTGEYEWGRAAPCCGISADPVGTWHTGHSGRWCPWGPGCGPLSARRWQCRATAGISGGGRQGAQTAAAGRRKHTVTEKRFDSQWQGSCVTCKRTKGAMSLNRWTQGGVLHKIYFVDMFGNIWVAGATLGESTQVREVQPSCSNCAQ